MVSGAAPPGGRRLAQALARPGPQVAALVLTTALAWSLPRLPLLGGGITMLNGPIYSDMQDHLWNLDKLYKLRTLGPQAAADPFFAHRPGLRMPAAWYQWPVGVYLTAMPWVAAFGVLSVLTTTLVNLQFTLVLLAGLVGLGARLHSARLGLLAGVLALLCPSLAGSSLRFSLDYPLVAMVTLGLYLLVLTDGFGRRGPTVAFAAWSALGTMVKMSYGLYLLVPALCALLQGLRRGPRRPARLALAAGALLLSLGLFWGLFVLSLPGTPDPAQIWRWTMRHLVDRSLEGAQVAPLTGAWLAAVGVFVVEGYTWPLLLLALPGLWALYRRADAAARLPLCLLGGGYLLLTLFTSKMERYVHPLYPLLCLATAYFAATRATPLRRGLAAAGLVLAFAAVHGYATVSPLPWHVSAPLVARTPLAAYPWYDMALLRPADWEGLREHDSEANCTHRALVRSLRALSRAEGSRRPLAVVLAVRDPAPEPGPGQPRELSAAVRRRYLTLAGLAALPDRLIFPTEIEVLTQEEMPRPWPVLQAPALLFVHDAAWDPAREFGHLRVKGRRQHVFVCCGEPYRVSLTLASPRPGIEPRRAWHRLLTP